MGTVRLCIHSTSPSATLKEESQVRNESQLSIHSHDESKTFEGMNGSTGLRRVRAWMVSLLLDQNCTNNLLAPTTKLSVPKLKGILNSEPICVHLSKTLRTPRIVAKFRLYGW